VHQLWLHADKTMFNSARVAYLARPRDGLRRASWRSHGQHAARSRERKQRVVEEFRASGLKSIKANPELDLITGNARFIGPHKIEVQIMKAVFSH